MISKRKEIYWSVDSSPSDSVYGPLINGNVCILNNAFRRYTQSTDIGNTKARLRSTVTAPQVKKKTSSWL